MKRTHARTTVVLGLVAGILGACRVESNGRLALGEDLRIAGTDPEQMASRDEAPAIPARGSTLRPRAVTLDRSGWESRTFLVPYDGVRHIPSYTRQWTPRYDHRSSGRSPTPLSALDLGNAGYEMGVMEGVGNGAIAVFDAVMIVPRALASDYFWERNQSPQWPYERHPTSAWLALSLAPEVSDGPVTGTLLWESGPDEEDLGEGDMELMSEDEPKAPDDEAGENDEADASDDPEADAIGDDGGC